MWGWLDHLGGVVFRGGLAAAALTSLAMLAMLACRQPACRIALARATTMGLLLLVPLLALAPLPRLGVAASLRDAGILPHPLFSTAGPDDDAPGGPGGSGAGASPSALAPAGSGPGGAPTSRALLLAYLAVTAACMADLLVGFWGLGWLARKSSAPSPRSLAIYDALPYSGHGPRPRLRVADRVGRPVLLGCLRPTILIPTSLDDAAEAGAPGSARSLRLIFLHELAHAEHSDHRFRLAGRLAQAFWFFLPTLWWIRARMHLDHEFLADRRAALRFDAPGTYASSLVGLAAPQHGDHRGGSACGDDSPARGAGLGNSSLVQRVLMLVQCPFAVETRPSAWSRRALPVLTLLLTPAAACLSLDLEDVRRASSPGTPAPDTGPQTFRMARLSVAPRPPDPGGRSPAVELPLRLPAQFDLTLEVWGTPALLSRSRVAGRRLGPPAAPLPERLGSEAWHVVRLRVRRHPDVLSLSVDGRPVAATDAREPLSPRLSVEPPPDLPAHFRKILVTWESPHP
jgi:beta-lactamase regulating signal transducer with metallopeptidase domain